MPGAALATVMLVDDDPLILALTRRVLARVDIGWQVLDYERADLALERLRCTTEPRIDLVFLDIRMPCMDGFEFLRRATESGDTPGFEGRAIMLTSSADPYDRAHADRFEIVEGFMTKPLDAAKIHTATRLLT